MPVITVRLGKGRPLEIKRRLAAGLTDIVVQVLDSKPSDVTVLIEEYERENWATGGELHADRKTAENGPSPPADLEALFKRKPVPERKPAPVSASARTSKAKSPPRRSSR